VQTFTSGRKEDIISGTHNSQLRNNKSTSNDKPRWLLPFYADQVAAKLGHPELGLSCNSGFALANCSNSGNLHLSAPFN
jgi:hypothetical protein